MNSWNGIRSVLITSDVDSEGVKLQVAAFLITDPFQLNSFFFVFRINEFCDSIIHIVSGQRMALPFGIQDIGIVINRFIFTLWLALPPSVRAQIKAESLITISILELYLVITLISALIYEFRNKKLTVFFSGS